MLMLQFQVVEESFGLDIISIIEIAPYISLKTISLAPKYVAGFFNYRGAALPVIDLTMLLADTPSRKLLSTRIIVVKIQGNSGRSFNLGLLAEQATETIDCNDEDFQSTGIEMKDAPFLGGVLFTEKGMIRKILIDKLVPEDIRKFLFEEIGLDK